MIALRSSSDMSSFDGREVFCDAMSCSMDCISTNGCPTNPPSVLDNSTRPRSQRSREFTDSTNASSFNSTPPSTSEPSPSDVMKVCDFGGCFSTPKVLVGLPEQTQFQNVAFS